MPEPLTPRAQPIPTQAGVSEQTSSALRSLFAIVERYPEIKSAANVSDLQDEIERLEGMIADRRELYNDQVYRYNTRIAQFPVNALARLLRWRPRDFFAVEPGDTVRPDHRWIESRRVTDRSAAAGPIGTIEPARREPGAERQVWLVRHGETEWARLRPTHRPDRRALDRARPRTGAWPSGAGWPVIASRWS